MRWNDIINEGDVVSLGAHKVKKAGDEYASAIQSIIAGEGAFFKEGKFLPFAETYIRTGKGFPEIIMDVSVRSVADMRARPELKEFMKELRLRGFKVEQTKYHKSCTMSATERQGPWARKSLGLDDLRQIWGSREHSPYGAYQESRSGFRTAHKDSFDERGVGFNICVGGIDSRRGDKYGNADREEHHIIDNDADFKEVMDMFALINRARMKSV
jgi:hypothetical protein